MNKKTPQDYLNEARRLLKHGGRDCTYWDLRMTGPERAVILRAAGLPTDSHHVALHFAHWSDSDRRRIKEAVKRASQWAAGLGVA